MLSQLFGGNGHTALLVWIGGIGLSLALPLLAVGLAVRAFRDIATPLADVMAAADAVAELLADVGTSFSGQAEAAGIDLRVEIEGDASDLTITGDVGRLDQVLSNLLANTMRYTPVGGVVTLQAQPTDGGVRIVVRDIGEGIPAEDLPFTFDRFWRGDRSRSHAGGAGSGLGLAIARQLVQTHGGRIGVESEPGRGTTFTVELPAGEK